MKLPITLLIVMALPLVGSAETPPDYKNPSAPLEKRVESLFDALMPDERLTLLSGKGFATRPVPRLGIPPLAMVDASQGARGGSKETQGPATLFASSVLLAAGWDTDLAARIGQGVGEETLNKGTGAQVLLGPGVNIIRAPLGGRNGEYLSEDPYVAARMAVAYIQGLQSTGAAACVKHYAGNSQEFKRGSIDARIGERALREIYTPAFIAAVREGKVWTVMSAYNKVNTEFSSNNWYLQDEILKNEAGFDGIIMTDWGGLHSTRAIDAGCDLEMPGGGGLMPDRVSRALEDGSLHQANVDDAVRRILRTIIRVGLMNEPRTPDHSRINSPAHQQLAPEAGEKGMVLLKNDHAVLPLDASKLKSIALIGPGVKKWQMGVGGSAYLDPLQSVNAYDGIVARAGQGIAISYVGSYERNYTGEAMPSSALKPASGQGEGLTREFYEDFDLSAKPVATQTDPKLDVNLSREQADPKSIEGKKFRVVWTGSLSAPVTGSYRLNLDIDTRRDGGRLYVDGNLIQDKWPGYDGAQAAGRIDLVAGKTYAVRIDYLHYGGSGRVRLAWLPPGEDHFKDAVEAARQAEAAVVVVGSEWETEARDRSTLALPGVQEDLVRAVAAANPKTIVVLNNGGPLLVSPWIDQVPAVVEAFLPGQAGGTALAKILFGDVNPSGKLTYTIARAREDYPDFGNYPVRPGSFDLRQGYSDGVVDYKEGIYVGYRAFDKRNIEPGFPFGHGLSYTTFRYGNVTVSSPRFAPDDRVTVTADITNTGQCAGAEVVQIYLRANLPKIDRPVRELKGFARVELRPGETRPVSFTVTARDFAYCDVEGKQWKSDAGVYTIELGASSRDLRAESEITLNSDYTMPIPGMGAVSPYGTITPAIPSEPIVPLP